MRKIAIYGKGGIGKSTTTANVAAAFARMGHRVMQIGCDPKADSTVTVSGGRPVPTVLDTLRRQVDDVSLGDIVVEGYGGILCVEAGGPTPGVGCAGRGIITAFEKLEELGAYERYRPDIVLYDVLGDVVCGGFAMPIRGGYAKEVFIVTSGEKMSLYAAANIVLAVDNFKNRGYARCAGLILNARDVENEAALVGELAREAKVPVIKIIPRDGDVQRAEALGKTVVEAFPDSRQAGEYQALAEKIWEVSAFAF
ncbi:MAG: AAA family ATPase [Peptococcaceae bacterium]|jgi:nitrogenase iron protein NifH|nr:AAA family ATPase [Peptococcaceae bacterium]